MLKIQHTYDMTTYPNIIDGYSTLPTVSGSTQEDIAINDLRAAVLAMETELGITPRGVYSDTRARLDILESRISYAISPTIISDGYLVSPLYLYNVPSVVTLSISDGYGIPSENRVDGSLFMRADGAANSDLYVRRAGAWKAIQTDLFTAAGDLSGTYLTQNVIGLQGKSLNSSLATIGASQDGYALSWDNADGYWKALPGSGGAFSDGYFNLRVDNSTFGSVTSQEIVSKLTRAHTTTATPEVLYGYDIPVNGGVDLVITILGKNSADGYMYRADHRVSYSRDAAAAPAILDALTTTEKKSGSLTTASSTVTPSGNIIQVVLTPVNAITTDWTCSVQAQQIGAP